MSLDPLLLDVLACPVDKGPLLWFEDEDVLYNPRLRKSYAVVDGVPVLLADEAVCRRRGRARAADGQGRDEPGAGHRPGVWVSERASPSTRSGCGRPRPPCPSRCPERSGRPIDAFGSVVRGGGRGGAAVFRAVAAFGLGTGGTGLRRRGRPHGARPGRSLLGGPRVRRPGLRRRRHAGPRRLVLGWHGRDADGGGEGGRARGHGGGRRGRARRSAGRPGRRRGLPWCPTPVRHEWPSGGGGGSTARAALGATTCPCWSRWPGPGAGPTARPRCGRPQSRSGPAPGCAPGAGRCAGRPGAPARAHHPAGLRLGRRDRRGGAVVEGPGEPQRQGAGLRGHAAGADPRRVGRVGPGRRRDAPDDVARAAAPCRRGAADRRTCSPRCGRPPTRSWRTCSRCRARATTN